MIRGNHSLAAAGLALALALGSAPAGAQVTTPPRNPPVTVPPDRPYSEWTRPGTDPLANAFFPPELVMRHQQAIGLTGQQRASIVSVIADAQPRFIDAQWQLEPETAALAALLAGDRVDEQAVLRQIDRVLDIERQIKRVQIEMLIRIKNQLTAEQQQQLARLGGARGLRGELGPSAYDLFPDGSVAPLYWGAGYKPGV